MGTVCCRSIQQYDITNLSTPLVLFSFHLFSIIFLLVIIYESICWICKVCCSNFKCSISKFHIPLEFSKCNDDGQKPYFIESKLECYLLHIQGYIVKNHWTIWDSCINLMDRPALHILPSYINYQLSFKNGNVNQEATPLVKIIIVVKIITRTMTTTTTTIIIKRLNILSRKHLDLTLLLQYFLLGLFS